MTRTIRRYGLVAEVAGSGPSLLLIHGLGAARTVWKPIQTELAESFTVIAVDLLGHGDSTWLDPEPSEFTPADHAAALEPLIAEFGPVHVVGNSMGGWVGLEIGSNGWAQSVTALCPAGLEFDPWVSRSDVLVQRRRLAQLLGPALPTITETVARTPGLRSIMLGDVTADFDSLDVSLLADGATAMSKARGFFSSHDGMLHHLYNRPDDVPSSTAVSIVWGTQDSLLPPERQRRVAAPAHATWTVFGDCAHVPMWDQPERTIQVIRDTAARAE